MAYGTVNADVIGTSVTGSNLGAGNASIMKNRIINGAMVIDQRNAGASVTPASSTVTYTLDRFGFYVSQASKLTVQQNAGSVTPPIGFSKYLGVTSSSAYSVAAGDIFEFFQNIEGFNTANLGWGTANAKTITISAWVYSSLTGTFGGSVQNAAQNRSYPFTYSIPVANTWTQISITVAGDTTGTWVGATNSTGISLIFSMGSGSTYSGTASAWAGANYTTATGATSVVGTSGATFYITGVQLEVGSSATGFEYRVYSTELANCQRYCPVLVIDTSANNNRLLGYAQTTTLADFPWQFPVTARSAATGITINGTFTLGVSSTNAGTTSTVTFNNSGTTNASIRTTTTVGSPTLAIGALAYLASNSGSATIIFNGCEL